MLEALGSAIRLEREIKGLRPETKSKLIFIYVIVKTENLKIHQLVESISELATSFLDRSPTYKNHLSRY